MVLAVAIKTRKLETWKDCANSPEGVLGRIAQQLPVVLPTLSVVLRIFEPIQEMPEMEQISY